MGASWASRPLADPSRGLVFQPDVRAGLRAGSPAHRPFRVVVTVILGAHVVGVVIPGDDPDRLAWPMAAPTAAAHGGLG
jgi:hypothetical protein